MKAIFVCDANPAYLGFWKPQAEHMWSRFGLRSRLYYIAPQPDAGVFTSDYAEVIHVPMTPDVPAIVQALFAKWYCPAQETTDERLFICDIDCFVLSRAFVDRVAKGHSLSHLSRLPGGNVPGYYVAGTPAQLRAFFQAEDPTLGTFCQRVLRESTYVFPSRSHVSTASLEATPDWKYFGMEEHYAGQCASIYRGPVEVVDSSPTAPTTRICRSYNCAYTPADLSRDVYVDFHCPRPFEGNEPVIRRILSSLPSA